MGVALGLAQLGVPEDLLHDADVGALLQQERGGGVACVMDPRGPDAGLSEQGSQSSQSRQPWWRRFSAPTGTVNLRVTVSNATNPSRETATVIHGTGDCAAIQSLGRNPA